MTDHRWKKDRDGAESCEREACAVRKFGKKWQEKKGRRWNPSHMPLPPCVGKEAAEVKEGLPPLTPEQIEQRAEYARKVLEKRKAPSPSPLEVVRDQIRCAHDDVLALLSSGPTTGERISAAKRVREALSALATLEESIRQEATRFYREREAYFAGVFKVADSGQFRADWEGAVKRWEESIRADEREKCAELIEDKWVGCHRMAESCGRDGAAAIRNRK